MHGTEHAGAALVSGVVTGVVVAIPEAALTYGEKVLSVFVLAVVAEMGRRLVGRVAHRLKKGKQP